MMDKINIESEQGFPEWDQAFIEYLATEYEKPIINKREELYEVFFKDIRELDDMEKFKKNKTK